MLRFLAQSQLSGTAFAYSAYWSWGIRNPGLLVRMCAVLVALGLILLAAMTGYLITWPKNPQGKTVFIKEDLPNLLNFDVFCFQFRRSAHNVSRIFRVHYVIFVPSSEMPIYLPIRWTAGTNFFRKRKHFINLPLSFCLLNQLLDQFRTCLLFLFCNSSCASISSRRFSFFFR